MKEVLKNAVASGPFLVALGFGYAAQPFLYVAKKFTVLGMTLHEKLGTSLGKEITKKREAAKKLAEVMGELQKRMEAMQKGTAPQQAQEEGEERLASIIKGNTAKEEPQVAGNVFILGKKNEDSGNQD